MTIQEANTFAEKFHMEGTAFQNGDASFWRRGDASKREPYHVYSHFYFAKELEERLLTFQKPIPQESDEVRR